MINKVNLKNFFSWDDKLHHPQWPIESVHQSSFEYKISHSRSCLIVPDSNLIEPDDVESVPASIVICFVKS